MKPQESGNILGYPITKEAVELPPHINDNIQKILSKRSK